MLTIFVHTDNGRRLIVTECVLRVLPLTLNSKRPGLFGQLNTRGRGGIHQFWET